MCRWLVPLVSMSISAGFGASTAHGGDPAAMSVSRPESSQSDFAEPSASSGESANAPLSSNATRIEPRLDPFGVEAPEMSL